MLRVGMPPQTLQRPEQTTQERLQLSSHAEHGNYRLGGYGNDQVERARHRSHAPRGNAFSDAPAS